MHNGKAFFDPSATSMSLSEVLMFLANPFKPDLRVRREALSLSAAGHRVRILAWDRECSSPEEEEIEGVRVTRYRISAPYGEFLGLIPGFFRFYLALLLESIGSRPRVIHCHDLDTLLPGAMVSILTGASLVYDMHESYPDFIATFSPAVLVSFLRFIEPPLIRRSDLVIVTSTEIGAIARRAGAERVTQVLNCFDPFPEDDRARDLSDSLTGGTDFLVVYIGGLFPGRGLEEMTEAVSRVEGVTLFLGGYGPLDGELRELAERLGIGDRVVFGGEIDPSMVPVYDQAADLLFALYRGVDPNNLLTIPNKLFESFASGTPILVSDLGEKSRIVKEQGNGLVVDPDDIDAIVESIRSLKENADLHSSLRKAAVENQGKYSWKEMSERLIEGYSEILAEA